MQTKLCEENVFIPVRVRRLQENPVNPRGSENIRSIKKKGRPDWGDVLSQLTTVHVSGG